MSKIENIKDLYKQVKRKTDFLYYLADHFNREYRTVRNHWFTRTGGWAVPKKFQDEVITLLQNKIRIQNENKTNS